MPDGALLGLSWFATSLALTLLLTPPFIRAIQLAERLEERWIR